MKLIREEDDDRREEALRKQIEAEPDTLRIVNGKRKYSISFEVLDEARANNFLGNIMLANACGNHPEMEELMGIRCTSINFDQVQPKLGKLREMLKQFDMELEVLERSNV